MKKVLFTFITFIFLFSLGCDLKPTATIKLHRGIIQPSFTELAETTLENTYDINMPLSGDVERITVLPADKVSKGQVVAMLVQLPLQQEVTKANAEIKRLQATYNEQVRERKRLDLLAQKKYVSRAELEKAQSQEEALKMQLEHAQAAYNLAQHDLTRSVMRSPIDGVILQRFSEGQKWLPSGTPLMQIGDLRELEVEAEVLSQDAEHLQVGNKVILRSTSGKENLPGKVKRIDPGGFTKLSALGVEEQRVKVIVALQNIEPTTLGVGYRLDAEFFVGNEVQGALLVPRFSVLQNENGGYYVLKKVGRKFIKQMVEVGIKSAKEIEIIKGLTDSDVIMELPSP